MGTFWREFRHAFWQDFRHSFWRAFLVAFLITVVVVSLTNCSGTQGHWHYVKDPHSDSRTPCLVWQDNGHKDRDGVYCRVYPTEVGVR